MSKFKNKNNKPHNKMLLHKLSRRVILGLMWESFFFLFLSDIWFLIEFNLIKIKTYKFIFDKNTHLIITIHTSNFLKNYFNKQRIYHLISCSRLFEHIMS